MLMPKKVKHRKVMKGRMRGIATRGDKLNFGEFGLKTLEAGWITDRQIEAARIAMTRHIKRGGKVWIRMFPDKPDYQKTGGNPYGQRKGRAGSLGRSCSSGQSFYTKFRALTKIWRGKR